MINQDNTKDEIIIIVDKNDNFVKYDIKNDFKL